jgi:hypothetical protein
MENILISEGPYWILGIGAIGFFTRSMLKLLLDRNLEKHKLDLQKISIEHQTIFSKLYSERGEIIRILYAKSVIMERALNDLLGYPNKEFAEKAKKLIIELKHYFEENRIYFQEALAKDFEKLITTAYNAIDDAGWNNEHRIEDITDLKIKGETQERRLNGLMMVRKDLPEIKISLEKEFRSLLGVS